MNGIPPFSLAGTGAVSATVDILAGSGAVTAGGMKTYELKLSLDAGGEIAERIIYVDVADVDVSNWAGFASNLQIVINNSSGIPRFETITDGFDVYEDEIALLAIAGQSILPNDPLVLSASGTWLSSPDIERSGWGALSIQDGDSLPFTTYGQSPVQESVSLSPGYFAVPLGQTQKTYELELGISNLYTTATRTVEARVLNVDRAAGLSLDLPISATVTTETGLLEITSVSPTLIIDDTERVTLLLSGRSQESGMPIRIEAGGSALASPIRHATLAGQSLSQQNPLPFTFNGVGSIAAELEWEPGIDSVTDTASRSFILDVTIGNGDSAVTHQLAIAVQDVDVEERIRIKTPLAGTIFGPGDASRAVTISNAVTLLENERLELDVIGTDRAGLPVQLAATGTLLANRSLKELRLGDQFLTPDTILPMAHDGPAPVTVPLTIDPGYRALPAEVSSEVFSVSLALSDRYASHGHAFDVNVVSVPSVPTIEIAAFSINGVPRAPTTAIAVRERESMRMTVAINDPADWPLDISWEGGPQLLNVASAGDGTPVELLLSLDPKVSDGDDIERTLHITASNPDNVTSSLDIAITVEDSERRPTLSAGLAVNGEPRPFVLDPAIGRGDVLKVTFAAADPDPGDWVYLSARGSLFSPETIARVTFDRFDPHAGDEPPYYLRKIEYLEAELIAYPGAAALPEGASEATYTLAINVNDGLFGVNKSMIVTVTPSERPVLSSGLLVNGEPRPFVLNPVIGRSDVLKVTFEATDADMLDVLHMSADGPLFNSDAIERVTFGQFDPSAGHAAPYLLDGTSPLTAELEVFPGPHSVPLGAEDATYALSVNVNDTLLGISQEMILTVTPSLLPPIIEIKRISVDGVQQTIGPSVTASEGSDVEVYVEAEDLQGLQLTLELEPPMPVGAAAPIVVATGFARLTASIPIPVTGSGDSPILLRFAARNSKKAVAETDLQITVNEYDNPPDFSVVMFENNKPVGVLDGGAEIDIPIGANLSLIASATDPEGRMAIAVISEGAPPSALLTPPSGIARSTGPEPATVTINFTPFIIGERHSILFTGADSEDDGPSGDRQVRVNLRIITDNLAPRLSLDPSGTQTVTAGDLLFVILTAYDPDGDLMLFEVFLDNVPLEADHPQVVSYSGFMRRGVTSASLIFQTTDDDVGPHEILFTADDRSWQIQETIYLTVEPDPVAIENWSLY